MFTSTTLHHSQHLQKSSRSDLHHYDSYWDIVGDFRAVITIIALVLMWCVVLMSPKRTKHCRLCVGFVLAAAEAMLSVEKKHLSIEAAAEVLALCCVFAEVHKRRAYSGHNNAGTT